MVWSACQWIYEGVRISANTNTLTPSRWWSQTSVLNYPHGAKDKEDITLTCLSEDFAIRFSLVPLSPSQEKKSYKRNCLQNINFCFSLKNEMDFTQRDYVNKASPQHATPTHTDKWKLDSTLFFCRATHPLTYSEPTPLKHTHTQILPEESYI